VVDRTRAEKGRGMRIVGVEGLTAWCPTSTAALV